MTGWQLMTTANKETSIIARMGCCVFHSETRFANPILLDSEEDGGLNAWDWYNFIKHQFFCGKTLIRRFVGVKTNRVNIFRSHKPKPRTRKQLKFSTNGT